VTSRTADRTFAASVTALALLVPVTLAAITLLVVIDSLPALGATQSPDATPAQLEGIAWRMREAMRAQEPAAFAEGQRRAIVGMATRPEDQERIYGWGAASDWRTIIETMHDLMASDLRPDLARVKAPTLVLGSWAAYRQFAPRSAIEATFREQYAGLQGAKIELSDHGRHFLMYDDLDWMLRRIDAFLD